MWNPDRVRLAGRLAGVQQRLWAHILTLCHARATARTLMYAAAHLIRWLLEKRLEPDELVSDRLDEFLRERRECGYVRCPSAEQLGAVVRFLKRKEIATRFGPAVRSRSAREQLLTEYERYLVHERALTNGAKNAYLRVAGEFLADRFGSKALRLERLVAADVTSFAVAESRRCRVGVAKLKVTALRSLLRFLHVRGSLACDLTAAAPAIASWRLSSLPKGLPPGDVRRLLRGCDRRTPWGVRAFAVVLVLVRLGLRTREVAALTLDDVDWNRGELVVRGKGRREDRLPLPHDVGRAVASYVRRVRRGGPDRRIFTKLRAPAGGLTSVAISMIVRRTGEQAGLGHLGAHRLRHTTATQLLRRGASLPEIARVLRHRSIVTTAIYAKVDRSALRELARRWPGAAR